jgi:hypothetical protein
MKSVPRGKNTSAVEIGNVSAHGFWLIIGARELFLPFADFPWFKEAPIGKLLHVTLPHPGHLYWPDLDVDLALESIEHPNRYPLVSRSAASEVRETASKRRSAKGRSRKPRRA